MLAEALFIGVFRMTSVSRVTKTEPTALIIVKSAPVWLIDENQNYTLQ